MHPLTDSQAVREILQLEGCRNSPFGDTKNRDEVESVSQFQIMIHYFTFLLDLTANIFFFFSGQKQDIRCHTCSLEYQFCFVIFQSHMSQGPEREPAPSTIDEAIPSTLDRSRPDAHVRELVSRFFITVHKLTF